MLGAATKAYALWPLTLRRTPDQSSLFGAPASLAGSKDSLSFGCANTRVQVATIQKARSYDYSPMAFIISILLMTPDENVFHDDAVETRAHHAPIRIDR